MTFTEHMRSLRGDLTKKAFSRRLGIPLSTYHRYEMGERVPDINLLAHIVRCVGISADTLLGLHQPHEEEKSADQSLFSHNPHNNNKDAIIAHQQETIAHLTRALQALS